jgi:putative transposase
MGIAHSTCYNKPTLTVDDTALLGVMGTISDEYEVYGYCRIAAHLRHRGIFVIHKKTRRLMREDDRRPRSRRGFATTTDSDHDLPIFPDLVRDMILSGLSQLLSPFSLWQWFSMLGCARSSAMASVEPSIRGLLWQP